MLFQNQNIKFDNNLLAGKMILSHFPGKMILSHFYRFFLYQFLFDLLNQLEIDNKRKLPFQANMFFRIDPKLAANLCKHAVVEINLITMILESNQRHSHEFNYAFI